MKRLLCSYLTLLFGITSLFFLFPKKEELWQITRLQYEEEELFLIRTPEELNVLILKGSHQSLTQKLTEEMGHFGKQLDLVVLQDGMSEESLFDLVHRYHIGTVLLPTGKIKEERRKALEAISFHKQIHLRTWPPLQDIQVGQRTLLDTLGEDSILLYTASHPTLLASDETKVRQLLEKGSQKLPPVTLLVEETPPAEKIYTTHYTCSPQTPCHKILP
jgi:hypothetical protein